MSIACMYNQSEYCDFTAPEKVTSLKVSFEDTPAWNVKGRQFAISNKT